MKKNYKTILFLLISLTCCYMVNPVVAAENDALVIVTSFPESLFNPFRIAYSKKYPDTEITIFNKKTTAALSAIKTASSKGFDVFWASSPDAFELLKKESLLAPLIKHSRNKMEMLNGYPLSDPDGFYAGFAISGYGIMWNHDYLKHHQLDPPLSWKALTHSRYQGHIGMTSPSRSGTTHLIIEMILQSKGWEEGWAMLLEMAGNLATITARSYGVPGGIVSQKFGIGPVIDFFALSARAAGHPVSFVYDPDSTLLPGSIAILNNAAHPVNAMRFVNFVLSDAGQNLLFAPSISRLPLKQSMYADSPSDYPNPYKDTLVNENNRFDIQLSRQRYHLVNILFDQLITFHLKNTQRVWEAIHLVRQSLSMQNQSSKQELLNILNMAVQSITSVPITNAQSVDLEFASLFSQHKPGLPISA
ncbi:MAG: extracellular solute-binding protein, partial [Desulfobacula sp.]|nr:extracellular solute-binding protein [Desulfobacula sp.]